MVSQNRLAMAIQKKGRLGIDSLDLLQRCGLKLVSSKSSLFYSAENFPMDVILVRDDDIPLLIRDRICDVGIVGDNVLQEENTDHQCLLEKILPLGFGRCRLSIAVSKETVFENIQQLSNVRIATSYPNCLQRFLKQQKISAEIVVISGSVEVAPRLKMAEAICDLVSTGQTLEENNLKEVATVLNSQAMLVKTKNALSPEKQAILQIFNRRIDGVLQAQESKYILFHAPKLALDKIKKLLPGNEIPTIIALPENFSKVVVHVVSREGVFWGTLEKLRDAGATNILVLPVEKMMF